MSFLFLSNVILVIAIKKCKWHLSIITQFLHFALWQLNFHNGKNEYKNVRDIIFSSLIKCFWWSSKVAFWMYDNIICTSDRPGVEIRPYYKWWIIFTNFFKLIFYFFLSLRAHLNEFHHTMIDNFLFGLWEVILCYPYNNFKGMQFFHLN